MLDEIYQYFENNPGVGQRKKGEHILPRKVDNNLYHFFLACCQTLEYLCKKKLKMKKIIYLSTFITVLFLGFASCSQNYNKESINEEESINKDSLEREEIFKALGDTAFGNVLYGSDKKTAISQMNDFQERLKDGDGFAFDNIHFFSLTKWGILDYDTISVNYVDTAFVNGNVFYEGKLTYITWYSESICENPDEFDVRLNHFINLFKVRYGEPSTPYYQKNCWHIYHDYDNDVYYFYLGGTVAEWESTTKKIQIVMEPTYNWPKKDFLDSDLKYYLVIRFIDKTLYGKLYNYQKKTKENLEIKKKKEKEEAEKRDSIRLVNSL